jgi:hypothetical protein
MPFPAIEIRLHTMVADNISCAVGESLAALSHIKSKMKLCTENDLLPKLEVRVAFHICDAIEADAVGHWNRGRSVASDREKLESETLGQIADRMSNAEPTSCAHTIAVAEFMRRQTLAQLEATRAQIEAAGAAKETAIYTQRNAKYLLWSVIVLAVSSMFTLLLTAFGLWAHR